MTDHNATLRELFDFTVDDLAYNQAGQLSPHQRGRYRRYWWLGLLGMSAAWVGYAIFLIEVIFPNTIDPGTVLGSLLLLLFPLVISYLFVQFARDLGEGRVISQEGIIEKVPTSSPNPRSIRFREDKGRFFQLTPQQYKHIRLGQPYRIYYLPRFKSFLTAIEYLGDDAD
jgi:hypothetical protein